MTELERALVELATNIDWPATPRFELAAVEGQRQRRVPRLIVALAFVALAIGVAFAVPQARSALLRILHLGGVTIERVQTLPPVRERSLASGLGRPVSTAEAERALGAPVRLPRVHGRPRFYERDGIVSALIAAPDPVLLSEFRSPAGSVMLKKIVGAFTFAEPGTVRTSGDAIWIVGARHLFVVPPAAPRLAGNVLLWEDGGFTFRLEGRSLAKHVAFRLAREMTH